MRWKYYYIKELSLHFIFIVLISYLLYAFIDYASHGSLFHQENRHLGKLMLYYFYQFSLHAEVLLPLALLLATLRVLLTANIQREFLLLLAAGLSLKKISRPFLLFALLVMTLCYLNFEYLLPKVYLSIVQRNEDAIMNGKVHALTLRDHSLLIYQSYDPHKQELFDLCWQKDLDHIYKMERLSWKENLFEGSQVDYLVREALTKNLHRVAHYDRLLLPIPLIPKEIIQYCTPPKWQSITQLFLHLSQKKDPNTTHFFYKLLMPLITWIVIGAPLAFCLHFKRTLFPFLIYALSLFGYITLFTILSVSVILVENQILHPALAMGLPLGSLLCYLGYKYARL